MASARRLPTSYDEETYNSAGGADYTSLATWEDATDTDLVTATKGKVLTCAAGVHAGSVTLSGATTNASYFRVIRAASGQRGTPTSGVRFVKTVNTTTVMFSCGEQNVKIHDIAASVSDSGTTNNLIAIAFLDQTYNTEFVGCTPYSCSGNGTNSAIIGFNLGYYNGSSVKCINCFATGITGNNVQSGGFNAVCGAAGSATHYLYNCTATNNSKGINLYTGGAGMTVTVNSKNCIFQGNTTNIYSSGAGTETHNQTNNATSGVTFAADGYHLASTDTGAIGNGTDLSADDDFAFTDDIDGETRDDWDIGADEYFSYTFIIADASSTSSIENITLESGAGEFAIDNAVSASSAENIDLAQAGGTFAIADSVSASTAENVVLEFNGGTFTIANAESTSSAEEITLIFNGTFTIANAESGSSIENIELSQDGGDFIIANAESASSIENIDLIFQGTFEVDDAVSTSSVEGITLAQASGLFEIADSVSGSSAENVELIFNGGTFEIQDCNSPPTIENITLEFAGGTFEIADSVSTSTIENIDLVRPSNFTEAQLGEIISLIVAMHEGLK